MTTITITISRTEVLNDMRVKSHAEVASIKDDKERYLAELGSEKLEEAHQCINNASAEVEALLRPFMGGSADTESENDYDASSDMVYAMSVTPRKAAGLAAPLAKAIHSYIVNSALAKFYVSVSRADLAERRRADLPSVISVINNLIYQRTAPNENV